MGERFELMVKLVNGPVSMPGSGLLRPFPVLVAFLVLTFLTGGSSWGHEAQLIILRPVALLVAAFGLASMSVDQFREHRVLWVLLGLVVGLTALHLVPLPYAWWSQLPGRQILIDGDAAVGFDRIFRPLSMQPEATTNALYSLAVPLAVLSLGVQLSNDEQRRVAGVLLVGIMASALVGLLQLSGSLISFYEAVSAPRPSGLFNNRNHQGAMLAMAFPLAVLAWNGGYRLGLPKNLERITAGALAVLVLPLSVVTGSRAGLILCSVALVLAFAELPLGTATKHVRLIRALKAGVVAVFFAGLGWLTVAAGRGGAIDRLTAGDDGELRYPVWQSIMDMIPAYWPWGTGIGTYADAYALLEPDALLRPTFSNHAHNDYLEIAFTAGVPGLLILTGAILAVSLWGLRAIRVGRRDGALQRTGLVITVILALASLGDYPVRTPIMMAVLVIATIWLSRVPQGSPVERSVN